MFSLAISNRRRISRGKDILVGQFVFAENRRNIGGRGETTVACLTGEYRYRPDDRRGKRGPVMWQTAPCGGRKPSRVFIPL
jgi:hypothetical protein